MGDVVVALNGAPLSGSASSAFRAFAVGTSVTFGLASAGVNFLEHASGLGIDRDGESGATPIGRLALRQRRRRSTTSELGPSTSFRSTFPTNDVEINVPHQRRRRSTFPSTSEISKLEEITKLPLDGDHESPRRRRSQNSKHSNTSSEGQIPPLQQQGAPSPAVVPALDELGKMGTSGELAGAMSPGMSVTGASGRRRRHDSSSFRPRTKIGTSDELAGAISPGMSVTGASGRRRRHDSSRVRPRTESAEEVTL